MVCGKLLLFHYLIQTAKFLKRGTLMIRSFTIPLLAATIAFAASSEAFSQATRTLGATLQPQASPGGGMFGTAPSQMTNSVGSTSTVSGPAARFLRGNRSAKDFVGNQDTKKFVGAIQADGTFVRPAAADAIERRVPEVLLNPPRQPIPATRMYEPKLSIGFQPLPRTDFDVSSSLQNQMNRLNQRDPSVQVTTTVEGATVRLEGQVPSEEQRALIEQMMLFEPGISAVQNDLKVLSAAP